MPIGAIWNAITGRFSSRTEVQDLIRDYERLRDRLDDAISKLRRDRNSLRDDREDLRDRLRAYTDATGEVATIYYDAIDENREKFRTVHNELNEVIADLVSRRTEADSTLGQLRSLHQIEIDQERAFTLSEIRVRLH